MSFPRYPEYKDSGVEWLGEVPFHWPVSKLKWYADVYSGRDQKVESGNWPIYGANGPIGECNQASLFSPHVLVGRVGSAGAVNYVTEECGVSDNALIIENNSFLTPRFIYYLLAVRDFTLDISTTAQPLLTGSLLKDQRIPVPKTEEQTDIASFLDHETAKIDALVAEQEKLIALLQEKRQAVISHAVAKGLDPNVPMKDSGVEWLGEVPEHWVVRALKSIVSTPITDGPHETPQFLDEGIPFVSAEAVAQGFINFDKVRGHISPEDHLRYSQKYLPRRGDVYMVKSGATTGVTALVETDLEFNIWSPLAALRCSEKMLPKFLLHYMRSRHFQEAVTLNWSFGTQQNIGMGVIGDLSAPIPPLSEQTSIATFLDSEIVKLDALTAQARTAITLLQERRTALISATVTGQIDVRGLASASNAPNSIAACAYPVSA